jgi:hypothetical protein
MYRKFDVTGNLLFAQYFFFFEELNTAKEASALQHSMHDSRIVSPYLCEQCKLSYGNYI